MKMEQNFHFFDFSHLDSKALEGFSATEYFCPQYKSKYCELPIECKACRIFQGHGYRFFSSFDRMLAQGVLDLVTTCILKECTSFPHLLLFQSSR